ncbi:membrane bound O-acyl transferase family-domain-containing protein [Cantharellus anzutake]|uniref:membrane bound O-acyl transferase family-domain-containing protein n=1 Tax=Cantharellus anzutake TaxID=1750568 RepID=UPI0019061F6B|nr:membrane bound O-acyl transferase family-domain-containing protein [Cantharellus anzutake]KAF8332346.1 membrane bound O-acyl transferase family-domain-containing protein [Cantharellus anzutake]
MQSRKPFNFLLPLLAECIFIGALSLKSCQAVARASLAPVIIGLCLYCIVFTTTGVSEIDYGVGGILMSRVFLVISLLLLLPKDTPILQNDEIQQGLDPDSLPVRQRLLRSFSLLVNPRGIGWNCSMPSAVIPETRPIPRRSFILNELIRIPLLILVLDAKETLQAVHPLLNVVARADDCSVLRLRDQPYPIRCVLIGMWAAAAYAVIMLQWSVLSVLCVGSGLSKPKDWPTFFGPLKGCWTVRRFWGKTWHQLFRFTCVSHGRYVSRKLGFALVSSADIWTTLVVAFIVSAAIHSLGGDYMAASRATISYKFYLSQPIAVALETLVSNATSSWLPHVSLRKAIGYVWVVFWFSWSTVDMLDGLMCQGMMRREMFPSFIFRPLLEHIWNGTNTV